MDFRSYHRIVLCLLLVFAGEANAQFYNGSENEFGKNRVQYRDFLWQQYRFKEFDTYFYEGGQGLARFTSRVAHKNIRSLEELFDYPIGDKIQFIVYNTQSDFKQSNIGLSGQEEEGNIGGTTQLVGSKVFVYFEGDYPKFERNIRKGIARVLINQKLYGGNWRDVIKSATLLNLPDWYIEGLVLYASHAVDENAENIIRSGIMTGKFERINRLEGQEAELAGYALWKYVAEVYGENVVPNILYTSGVSRNMETGFLYVLGKSFETISKEFNAYYRGEYGSETVTKSDFDLQELSMKTKKNRIYTAYEVSPDGRYALYVSNILGQYRLFLYDVEKGKRKKILKAEHKLLRIPDRSFPVLAWHPSGRAFSYVREWRGKLMLTTYNLDTKKETEREIFHLDKVLSMEYDPGGQRMILSAVDQGQTDLYLYHFIGNRQERLTNDPYGDFDPSFTADGNRVLFSSNRPDDTLRTNVDPSVYYDNRDVYVFNLQTRSPYLERITNTPDTDERHPMQYPDGRYTYTADYRGTTNRYVAKYDSVISRIDTTIHYRYFAESQPLTDYVADIHGYHSHTHTGRYGFMTYTDGRYRFFTGLFADDDRPVSRREDGEGDEAPDETGAPDPQGAPEVENVDITVVEPPDRKGGIDLENYRFEGETEITYRRETVRITELPGTKEEYRPSEAGVTVLDSVAISGARNYNLNFSTDKVLAQLDNSFMSEFYQPLSGPSNLNPGLGGLMKFATSDLFEDYKISGGFSIAGNFDNNTVMLMGEDLSGLIDHRTQVFRQQSRFASNFGVIELVSYQVAHRISRPVNEVFSIRLSGMYRHDKYVRLAMDRTSAASTDDTENYAGLKGEIVFDNTLPMGLNLRRGMRWKVWTEYFRDPFNFDRDFMTMGLDARHYTKIHRNLIWANRVAWSTSLGKERLAFFLGGVDNWIGPKEDNSLPLAPDQNYVFQTRGGPMRGFYANARNGNSFAVINSEIRWPIFSYLSKRPLNSDFLQNFQLVGFFDVGSAWTGLTPYSEDNYFNSTIITQGNLTIEIENNRNPVIFGYGAGVRAKLLGYFVRADWAQGIDDGRALDPVLYISLAMDF